MKALLLIGTILGALALATAAAADNGASVTNASWCTAASPFATVCQDVKYVLKVETTPAGNVSYDMNGTTASTASIPLFDCTTGETDVFHEHWLSKDGELQTQSQRSIQTTHGQCGSWSYTCVLTVQMHFVNGEVEVRKDDFVCTDSLSG